MAEVIWGGQVGAADLNEIGLFTGVLGLALWAWSAQMLVARGLCQGRTRTPTVVGSSSPDRPPLYAHSKNHGGGLTMASGVVVSTYVFLFGVLGHNLSAGPCRATGGLFLRMALSAGGGAAAAVRVKGLLADWSAFPRGLVAGLTAIVLTVGLGYVLQVTEIRALWDRIAQRFRKTA